MSLLSLHQAATTATSGEPFRAPCARAEADRHGGGPVGAPIDGGLGILLAMGAAYGGKKLYKARQDKKKEAEEQMEVVQE